ncbi:hypothetical protein [Phenylobacterium sp.]|uniref:hypothetical protein n=1 Tax=Phenylobacterium sp. TaxID=1871053 RepID=UPI0025E19FC0|nr:hypothetical protein [Phenylobacterium sp.]
MFILKMGQLGNEINLLRFQMLVAMRSGGSEIHNEASNALTLINARFLAGRLYEGWVLCGANVAMLRKYKRVAEAKAAWREISRYFSGAGAPMGQKADNKRQRLLTLARLVQLESVDLPPGSAGLEMARRELKSAPDLSAKDAIRALRAEAGKLSTGYQSVIERLRHKVAFHNDDEAAGVAYDAMTADDDLSDFHTCHRGAVLYGSAQTLNTLMMISVTGNKDRAEAVDRIMGEIHQVASHFYDYVEAVMQSFFENYMQEGLDALEDGKVVVDDAIKLSDIKLQYFCLPVRE